MKKGVLVMLVLALIAMAGLTGCSEGSGAQQPSGSEGKQLPPATLKFMFRGERPADMDKVIAEIENRLKDTLNVKLDIVFVPNADMDQKRQVTLASGEPLDLVFDAPWATMSQMIAAGYYEPLDDLLQKHGKSILATRGKEMIDANRVDGKIMGIPLGAFHYQGRVFMIRKDIREKLGLKPLKSYEDLKTFLLESKKKFPDSTPFSDYWDIPTHVMYDFPQEYLMINESKGLLYFKGDGTKVVNLLDEMPKRFGDMLKDMRAMYKDKVINPDVLNVKNGRSEFEAGKSFAWVTNDFGMKSGLEEALKKNVPDAQVEIFQLFEPKPKAYVTPFKQWNFAFIPKVSKNKERVIQFLEWAHQKEHYDLVAYGIKGEHWEPVGDKEYKPLNTKYSWFPFMWVWNPSLDRLRSDLDPQSKSYYEFTRKPDNFVASKLTGFTFNLEPLKSEKAQLDAVYNKYFRVLAFGVADTEETLAKFKVEAGPPLKKMQEEFQKQVDAFLAVKKQ